MAIFGKYDLPQGSCSFFYRVPSHVCDGHPSPPQACCSDLVPGMLRGLVHESSCFLWGLSCADVESGQYTVEPHLAGTIHLVNIVTLSIEHDHFSADGNKGGWGEKQHLMSASHQMEVKYVAERNPLPLRTRSLRARGPPGCSWHPSRRRFQLSSLLWSPPPQNW